MLPSPLLLPLLLPAAAAAAAAAAALACPQLQVLSLFPGLIAVSGAGPEVGTFDVAGGGGWRLRTSLDAAAAAGAEPAPPPLPRATAEALRRGALAIAELPAEKMAEVLERLSLYGLLESVPADPAQGGGPTYALIWPLLQFMAAGMFLREQRERVLAALRAE